jgi:hypothetical protein
MPVAFAALSAARPLTGVRQLARTGPVFFASPTCRACSSLALLRLGALNRLDRPLDSDRFREGEVLSLAIFGELALHDLVEVDAPGRRLVVF